MLRLNFSRISLDKKDLDFHRKTHQRRQVAREHGHSQLHPKELYSESPRSIKSRKISLLQSPAEKLAASSEVLPTLQHYEENPIISREPVPRGSRAFWDRVLAEAGTPTRTQSTGSGNARVIDPSEDWLENHRSTRASIDEDRTVGIDSQDDQTSSGEIQAPGDMPYHQPSLESVDFTHIKPPEDITRKKSLTASLESIRHSAKHGRFSNLFRRRPRSFDAVEDYQQPETLDLGLDGHQSDLQQHRNREYSNSSDTSHPYSIMDGLYGSKRDRRTISSSLETSVMHGLARNQPSATERVQHSSTMSPDTVPTTPIGSGGHSGTTSGSYLHISDAAVTGSPRMNLVAPNELQDQSLGGLPSFLSLPPRRPRKYRPRSETCSYELSEASSATTQVRGRHPMPDGMDFSGPVAPGTDADHAVISAESFASVSPLQTTLGISPYIQDHPLRTPTEMKNHRAISHNTSFSNTSSSFRSSRSSLSPFALPFVPRTTPTRNMTPQYQLPPPFGSTPRTVSYSHTMPTTSSPITPLDASPSLPYQSFPNTNATPESIPATPPRSSFRVYNDGEPPHTQPQTPADLHRRRRLHLHNTAPARGPGVGFIEHGIARWQAFASPPRSGRTPTRLRPALNTRIMEEIVSTDIENQDTITASERERRRVWNGELRMGQEERRRLDLSPGLMGRRVS